MSEADKKYFLTEEEEQKVPSLQEINRRIREIQEKTPDEQPSIDWNSVLFSSEEYDVVLRVLVFADKAEKEGRRTPEFWEQYFRNPENASMSSRALQHIRNGDW